MAQPVLIIGAGPVGLTLACELARYGIPVRIVEKLAQRTDKSKALVLWSRTLELLERGGGSEPFVAAGFKVDAVNLVASDGNLVGHVDIRSVHSPYPYALMIPQSETERLLEERLRGFGVSVEREVEVTGLTFTASGADAILRHADGRDERVATEWLLGCDGAHSIVRHTLGAAFTGETMLSDWMLADVHMRGYPYPDTEASVCWHQDGAFVIFPISPGRYRLIADLPKTAAEQPPAPTLEQVQAILDRRGPPGATVYDPIWLAGFRINSRKVSDYRAGRAFLLGDAAHIHSPAGGQGMNTGMQDAFNLAWKLALVMNGTCADRLLDSYGVERGAVGDEVLKNAGRLTTLGTLKNPIGQGLRNLVGHIAFGFASVQHAFADTMAEITIAYADSPLNGPAAKSVSGPKPGQRIAPSQSRPIGSGSSPRFALFARSSPGVTDLLQKYEPLLDPELRPALQADAIWLARPDGYVACSADSTAVIAQYLEQLRASPASV